LAKRFIAVLVLVALAAVGCGGSEEEGESLSPVQARQYFTNIDSLLGQAVAAHEQGDTEEAAELVGEAYLENFEHLEHDLEAADPELNEELEDLLGPGFRQDIQEGISQDELETRVAEAAELLEQAKTVLGVA
jgi:hypothetical protein